MNATQTTTTAAPAKRLQGFICTVNPSRGFCFLRVDDGTEYFLHYRDLKGGEAEMVKGSRLEFTPVTVAIANKNDRATEAVVISRAMPTR